MTKIYDSVDDYTKDELLAVAEQFGTDVKHSISKKDLVERLEEDGITVELIKGFKPDTEEELKEQGLHPLAEGELEQTAPETVIEEEEENLVLVKMTRPNGTYQTRGYTFKRLHPYGLVREEDADFLVEHDGGFRMATPKEAREYYS